MPADSKVQADAVCAAIVNKQSDLIKILVDAVAIAGVSCEPARSAEVIKTADFLADAFKLASPGCQIEKIPLVCAGSENLPPLLSIQISEREDSKKPTLLIYGHYDVQPADLKDGWLSDPFQLTVRDGAMYGRGSTDDKGPIVGFIGALKAFSETGTEIPINVRFLLEGQEEVGSIGFEETVAEMIAKKHSILQNVDYLCISDNYWMTTKKPCLTYGVRGGCTFQLRVSGPKADNHSGVCGGVIHEPTKDLIWLMSHLEEPDCFEGLVEQVRPVTSAELATYENLDYDPVAKAADLGVSHVRNAHNPKQIMMDAWRNCSVSFHGIEGAYSGPGVKTVIPGDVKGKISIRLVPDVKLESMKAIVENTARKIWTTRNTANKLDVEFGHAMPYWVANPADKNFAAAADAIEDVFGVKPDLTREGGSIPPAVILSEGLGKSLCMIPMGRSDDGAHAQNEKLDITNFIQGTQVFVRYFFNLAKTKE